MKTKYFLERGRAKAISLLLATTTILAASPAVWAESPSDLMEQGVYSEETKGDLGSALQLYQKVIAQAKTDRALAAQAQYHLGVCYYKQQNYTDANTAFETVIRDYADQKEIAALARKYLADAHPLQPAPWKDHELLRLDVKLPAGIKIGIADYAVNAGQATNGQKIWRCNSHLVIGGIQSVSQVEVDADSFSPIHSLWRHTLLSEVNTTYYADHADMKTTGKDEIKKLSFDAPIIDNEECLEWMRRLPLADGYTNNQPILASLGAHIIPVTATVSGPEKVTVPAGTYDCYKIDLSIAQTFWYSADTNRYLVKFEGGGAIGELSSISYHSPDATGAYTDPTNGFSMTAPAGWTFFREDSDEANTTSVRIVDPEGLTTGSFTMVSRDVLSDEAKKSGRDYAETKLKAVSKMNKNFTADADGFKECTVARQPAYSITAEYSDATSKKKTYIVWGFNGTNAIAFQMNCAPKNYSVLQPKFLKVVESFTRQ